MKRTQKKSDRSPGLTPHPVLDEYYPDSASRRQRIDEMFDASARHYDLINTMMSFGSGRFYRAWALKRHGLLNETKMLDVGCGTGALALIAQQKIDSSGTVIALDPSSGMLQQARNNGVKNLISALGESVPFAACQFNMLTMGYALRHVADIDAAFMEYHRVLEADGKVLLLEISKPENKLGLAILRFYMRGVVPLITRVFCRSRQAQVLMKYYWDTIESCVAPDIIKSALSNAGFDQIERKIILGIFSEYSAVKKQTE